MCVSADSNADDLLQLEGCLAGAPQQAGHAVASQWQTLGPTCIADSPSPSETTAAALRSPVTRSCRAFRGSHSPRVCWLNSLRERAGVGTPSQLPRCGRPPLRRYWVRGLCFWARLGQRQDLSIFAGLAASALSAVPLCVAGLALLISSIWHLTHCPVLGVQRCPAACATLSCLCSLAGLALALGSFAVVAEEAAKKRPDTIIGIDLGARWRSLSNPTGAGARCLTLAPLQAPPTRVWACSRTGTSRSSPTTRVTGGSL